MSVSEAKSKVSSSEYTDWMTFFDLELDQVDKTDYYLAQIAEYIVKGNIKDPSKYTTSDFLIKFDTGHSSKKASNKHNKDSYHVDNLSTEQVNTLSQKKWFAFLGISSK